MKKATQFSGRPDADIIFMISETVVKLIKEICR